MKIIKTLVFLALTCGVAHAQVPSANQFWAGPATGSAAFPIWRTMAIGDVSTVEGVSVTNPGTGTLEMLLPIQTVTGGSKTFGTSDLFKKTRRSNSGSGMTDTFPASSATGLTNGTRIDVSNVDASASDVITAGAGTTISGNSTYTVGFGRDVWFIYNSSLTEWFLDANTGSALLSTNNLSDLSSASSARTNLGLGTSATVNTGTSGSTIPLNNGGFTQSGTVNFTSTFEIGGITQTFPTSGLLVGTTDTQTLTNKTINGGTLSGTIAGTPTLSGSNFIALSNLVQLNADSFWANPTGSTANAEQVTLGSTLNWSGTTLNVTTCSATQLGACEPDGSTITASGGRLTAVGAAATSIAVSTTTVTSATASNYLLTTGTVSGGTGTLANVAPTLTVGGATCTIGSSCTPESVAILCGQPTANLSTSSADYLATTSISTTEAIIQTPFPYAATVKNMFIQMQNGGTPGGSASYTFTLRDNGSGTTLNCTISGSNSKCSDTTHTPTVSQGDLWTIQSIPSSSPSSQGINWCIEVDQAHS